MPSSTVDERQALRIERTKRGIGWRHQHGAIRQADTDIAGGARGEPPIEDRSTGENDKVALPRCLGKYGGHGSSFHALRKKSSAPKLPDFKASAIGFPSRASV